MSHRYELYVERVLHNKGIELGLYFGRQQQYHSGESLLGIEIKRDIKSNETGNIFIEYAERLDTSKPWVASGIFRKDNSIYYWIGDMDEYYIFRKDQLQILFNEIEENGGRLQNGCERKHIRRNTAKGFIIPKELATQMAISLDELIAELG